MNELTTIISGAAGALLALLFQYVPGLSTWFEAQSRQIRALTMLACILASSAILYAASCWQLWPAVACGEQGLRDLVVGVVAAILASLTANQATHQIAKHIR